MSAVHVNLEEINRYSHAFAKRLCDYFFIDHQSVEGKELLKFCDIQQVNLLILKNLFEKWQSENAKLKSPYFDYAKPEVKQAMSAFMNTLSQHISIQKTHFLPLLTEATRDALYLVLDPAKFYRNEIQKSAHSSFSVRKLVETQKYIQYNKQLLKAFIDQLKKLGQDSLSVAVALETFEKVYAQNQHYIEPTDWRLKNFSDIYSLDFASLQNKPAGTLSNTLDDATKIMDETPAVVQTQASQPTQAKTPQNLVGDPTTLNDTLKKNQENLHDSFQQAKIMDIRSAISLNQKFLFTNRLFNGDSFAFNDAITKIETCQNFNEATYVIQQDFANKYQWDFDSEEVKNFIQIIARRFE